MYQVKLSIYGCKDNRPEKTFTSPNFNHAVYRAVLAGYLNRKNPEDSGVMFQVTPVGNGPVLWEGIINDSRVEIDTPKLGYGPYVTNPGELTKPLRQEVVERLNRWTPQELEGWLKKPVDNKTETT